MLENLKEQVCLACKRLKDENLIILTWGNVSAYDDESGLVVIKPSGVPYDELTPEKMVVTDLNGQVVEGGLKPSVDLPTHLELYKAFGKEIKSVVHTHSRWATIWAQMKKNIPVLGTTGADDFGSDVLCTRDLRNDEIMNEYEKNIGLSIIELFRDNDISRHFGALVASHGPFVWESNPQKAVDKALVLEYIAEMAWHCCVGDGDFSGGVNVLNPCLLDKHFLRKHGKNSYYGQK